MDYFYYFTRHRGVSTVSTYSQIVPQKKYGGRSGGTNELKKPIAVVLDYDERWIKNKIDPVELVTLRESGLTYREIAIRLGSNRVTVWRVELAKLEYSIFKEARRTDTWGCREYRPERYR